MKLPDLPPRESLWCRLRLHAWSGWILRPRLHSGEVGWDVWQHMCMSKQRICTRGCGAVRRSMTKGICATGLVVEFPDQPHNPTAQEIESAAKALNQAHGVHY